MRFENSKVDGLITVGDRTALVALNELLEAIAQISSWSFEEGGLTAKLFGEDHRPARAKVCKSSWKLQVMDSKMEWETKFKGTISDLHSLALAIEILRGTTRW